MVECLINTVRISYKYGKRHVFKYYVIIEIVVEVWVKYTLRPFVLLPNRLKSHLMVTPT